MNFKAHSDLIVDLIVNFIVARARTQVEFSSDAWRVRLPRAQPHVRLPLECVRACTPSPPQSHPCVSASASSMPPAVDLSFPCPLLHPQCAYPGCLCTCFALAAELPPPPRRFLGRSRQFCDRPLEGSFNIFSTQFFNYLQHRSSCSGEAP